MTAPVTITIPHQLGRAEARRRIDDGFAKLVGQFPGSAGANRQAWSGDRLDFQLSALGQSIGGSVDVADAAVTIEVRLPGLLGAIANGLKDKLRKTGQLLLTRK